MIRIRLIIVSLITGISSVVVAPVARADDNVTYEVVSNDVAKANVEYFDHSARRALNGVPLPWRTDATVPNAHVPSINGAEVRADWRDSIATLPAWRPNHWVTVRIYFQGNVMCENTLDVGDAACYGSTTFRS